MIGPLVAIVLLLANESQSSPSAVRSELLQPASDNLLESTRVAHLKWRSSIRSLSFTSTLREVDLRGARAGREIRHIVKIKGLRRSVESYHLRPNFDWQEDWESSRTVILPDRVEVLWLLNRYLEIAPLSNNKAHQAKLEPFWNEPYLFCTGWWPADVPESSELPTPSTAIHMLIERPDALASGRIESVEGRDCVRVHIGGEVEEDLWFDMLRKYLLIRRIRRDRETNCTIVINNGDFRQVSGGEMLPFEIKCKVYVSGERVSESTRKLLNASINSVNDMEFNYPILPGTLVSDRLRVPSTYATPGGHDVLDGIVKVARRQTARIDKTTKLERVIPVRRLLAAVALGAVIGVFARYCGGN
jgi:hypothetical protein